MTNAIPPRSSSRCCGNYSRATDVPRLVEIFENSGQIALESKNTEIAQNNFDLTIEAYYQILALHPRTELKQPITQQMQILADNFPSEVCINGAIGICEKANKLKSFKAKLKYLLNAQALLEQGLARQDTDHAKITAIYTQVVFHAKQVEAIIEKQGKGADSKI
ncbi:MAG TPA: hypothetical protein VGI63_02360 [Verrucomicrobiae bacterium]|jgi:hypothetical protein